MYLQLTCKIRKWRIFINCDDDIADQMCKIVGRFSIEPVLQNETDKNVICISTNQNGSFNIEYNSSFYVAQTINDVLFLLYEAIDFYTKNAAYSKELSSDYCILHGGSVSYKNKAIGILAPSMTGKSTMICELVSRGFNYVADDYLFYHDDKVVPFQLPLRLRSIKCLSRDVRPYIILEGYNPYTNDYEYILDCPSELSEQTLAAIWVINRGDSKDVEISRMDSRSSFLTLVLNGKRSDSSEIINNYSSMLSISKSVPIYAITYAEVEDGAIELIKRMEDNVYE